MSAAALGGALAVCAVGGCLYVRTTSSRRGAGAAARAPPDAQADAPAAEAPAAAADEGGERAESAAGATEAAVTDQQQADIDSTRAQVLGLHGPISAELLEEIDALYAELKLEAVRDVLDRSLATEKDVAATVQLRQFRASVLFGLGDAKGSLQEYCKCVDDLDGVEATEETAEQINQFWAIRAALNKELGDSAEAEICLEEGESNGMLRGEAERLGAEIITGYKEDALHYQEMQRTGTVPEEFVVKVKTTAAVQKVSEMEAMDHLEATDRAQASVEETGMTVQVQVPEGAVGGQQVPCQTNPGMPAHLITIPLDAKAGDTIDVKLPKLEDLSEERLEEFVGMLSEAVDAGSKHPQLISGCLAKRAMHYLLLGKLTESLVDLGNLLAITEQKPVDEDPTAAEAYIMSGFVHRLCVMKCAMPPSKEAVIHEQKATAAFAKATKLGVDNLQESIATMEGEIQRAPKVRAIVEQYSAATAHMQKAMNAAAGGKGAAGSPPGSPKKAKAEAKAAIKAGSEAFDNEDYKRAIQHFTKALEKNPSEKLKKWLYKNRAVCYKYTKKYEEMLADASESCKLEPTVPEHYLRCAAALKQLGRVEELKAVCTKASALKMPPKLKEQLKALSPAA